VSGSEEKSKSIAETVIAGVQEGEVYVFETAEYTLKGYIRHPDSWMASAPFGITDCLVAHMSADGTNLDFVNKYISDRQAIPNKIVCCENTEACDAKEKFGAECVSETALNSTTFRESIVKAAITLDESLQAAFKKFDTNNNNQIDKDEIIQASKELGHVISDEDAQEIVNTIANNGKVDFESFKKWWIFGKTNFNQFRYLIKAEGTLAKTFQKGAPQFSNYLKELEAKPQCADEEATAHVLLGHYKEIVNGIGLSLHCNTGDLWTDMVKDEPAYYRDSLGIVGIELEMKDEQMVAPAVETIKQLLEMVRQIPQVGQAECMGVNFAPRGVGKSIFFEVATGGMIDFIIQNSLGEVDFSSIHWSGTDDMHLHTEATVDDLKSLSGEEIFKKLIMFRGTCEGKYSHVSSFLNAFPALLEAIPNQPIPSYKIKDIATFLKYVTSTRSLDLTLGFDNVAIGENIKKENEECFSEGCSAFGNAREEMLAMIGGMKEMIDGMLGPFKETLQGVNFDKISIFVNCSKLKAHCKLNIHLPGFTKHLNEIILS
jgi:hypothetical protein